MESLPELPLEQVLLHLDTADLLACSLVSVGWRASVNNNFVWKEICLKCSNKTTIDYLQNVPSKISPTFEEPESESERLEPLCHWRVVYMKLNHVNRNWRCGRYQTYNINDFAYDHFDLKINKNTLVTNVNDDQCDVWDIKSAPKKLQTIRCAMSNTRCKCMIHVSENRIVIIQDTMLQVYHAVSKHFTLQYRRLFNRPEKDSESIPGSLNIDEWYNNLIKKRPTRLQVYHVGKYFIGLAESGPFDKSSFHVWDTISGSKMREIKVKDIYPELKDRVYNVKFCQPRVDNGKILLCVQHLNQSGNLAEDSYISILYIYDLLTLSFRRVTILKPHIPWVYYEDHLILTIGQSKSKISVYASSNGEKLVSKHYEDVINPDSVQVHRDHMGFTTGRHLVILSIKDFNQVFTTAVIKLSSNLFGFDFVFLDWNLILLARWDQANKIQVWNMKDSGCLSTLGTTGLMFPSDNSAKFFVWNEMVTTICMLQFW